MIKTFRLWSLALPVEGDMDKLITDDITDCPMLFKRRIDAVNGLGQSFLSGQYTKAYPVRVELIVDLD